MVTREAWGWALIAAVVVLADVAIVSGLVLFSYWWVGK